MKHLSGSELESRLHSYHLLTERFEQANGYAFQSELIGVLKGLGFKEDEFGKVVDNLSGGQKTRVALGKLLLTKPDVLLLDEPTNHLDMGSISWLENYLLNYDGSVLIVSHDRYFLNRVVTKVIEIEHGELMMFHGNYSEFAQKKKVIREAKIKEYLNQQQEIKHQEAVIEKLRSFNREKSIKRAESREKLLDKMERIEKPMEVNIWRAPTDNDMFVKAEWLRAKFDQTKVRAYTTDVEIVTEKTSKAVIKCAMSMAANAVQKMLDMDTTWTIDADGAIALSMNVKRCPEFPMLPRFGLRLFLDKEMEQVEYYGMGPVESYVDKHRASSHGVYKAKVKELHEDYIRPQENGSHYDCSYVTLESEKFVLNAVSEQEFSFNASVYTQEELTAKKHNFELEESGNTVLCLDYAHCGIGSNSCGPELSPQYRVCEKEFKFDMKLIFEKK